jgi:hypothetical protein
MKDLIKNLFDTHGITRNGYTYKGDTYVQSDSYLELSVPEFIACCEFLKPLLEHQPKMKINYKSYYNSTHHYNAVHSYSLKHAVEKSTYGHKEGNRYYIANGVAIIAAIYMGFQVVKCDEKNPNALIGINNSAYWKHRKANEVRKTPESYHHEEQSNE